jgi:hypothetical protein
MTDLVFYGGVYGVNWGSQQFTTRNLTFCKQTSLSPPLPLGDAPLALRGPLPWRPFFLAGNKSQRGRLHDSGSRRASGASPRRSISIGPKQD